LIIIRPARGTPADPNFRLLLTLWRALYRHARFLSSREDVLTFPDSGNNNHCLPMGDDMFSPDVSGGGGSHGVMAGEETDWSWGHVRFGKCTSSGRGGGAFDRLWPAELD
jgi:hypothetical protein